MAPRRRDILELFLSGSVLGRRKPPRSLRTSGASSSFCHLAA
nr:MAG TPA: hypothetical protein [Caudoviricetes sp.]